jgi:excisionase family DNA binding protein
MQARDRTKDDALLRGGLVDALAPSPSLANQAETSIQALLGMGVSAVGTSNPGHGNGHDHRLFTKLCLQTGRQAEVGLAIGDALVHLPGQIAKLAMEILAELANGNGVALVRTGGDISTIKAAKLLGCSRPHVVKLVQGGLMRASMVGTHRRIPLSEVVRYKRERERQQAALAALDAVSQEFEGLDMPEREEMAAPSSRGRNSKRARERA